MEKTRQNGAALMVVLMVLLVSSLLAVTSAQNSTLKLKIASHSQDEQLSLQASEIALKEAESILSVANCLSGLSVEALLEKGEAWWLANGVVAQHTQALTDLAMPARYIVECLEDSQSAMSEVIYRVTTHSVGTSLKSITMVQSVYVGAVGRASSRKLR